MNEQEMNWEKEKEKLIWQKKRMNARFSCVSKWLELLEDGGSLIPYFQERKCHEIVIYGAAEMGRLLLKEIERGNSVRVSGFLDRNAQRQREVCGIPVYLPEEYIHISDADMVVVTAIVAFDAINDTLMGMRPEIPIVSLETIIAAAGNEVWYEQR